MLFGEEAGLGTWTERIITAVSCLLIGFTPKLWDVIKGFREQTPELAAANQKLKAKDQSMRQQAEDRIYERYQTWLDELQKKVDKLEKDHLDCQVESAQLRERCDGQLHRIEQMTTDMAGLQTRVRELEKTGKV